MFLVAVERVGVEADGTDWHWCSKRQCEMIFIYRAMDRLISRLFRNDAFSKSCYKDAATAFFRTEKSQLQAFDSLKYNCR
jgi:hypothetical protein